MPVRSEDYFKIAESLSSNSESEIDVRTAINRIYYGILHFIEESYGYTLPNSRVHQFFKDESKSHSYHEKLTNLEQQRVYCDYYNHMKFFLGYSFQLKDDIIKDIKIEIDPDSLNPWEVQYNEYKKELSEE